MSQALFTLLAAVVVTGGACLWVTAETLAGDYPVVVSYGMTASILLCLAVAAYMAQAVCQLREHVARMRADAGARKPSAIC